MADNATLPATGDVIAADDIGGVKFQRVKIVHGADGVNGGDVATGNPLPVALDSASLSALETTELGATTLAALETTTAVQGAAGTAADAWFMRIADLSTPNVVKVLGPSTAPVASDMSMVVALSPNSAKVTPAMQAARTLVCITYTATNAAAADTLLTTTINRGGTTSTATSHAVTAGKTLRITGIVLSLRTTTAATPWGLLSVRMNASGAAIISSPVILPVGVAGTAAVAGNTGFSNPCFDDGLEFSGANQLGFSFANNVNTNVTNFSVFGYEYTTPA